MTKTHTATPWKYLGDLVPLRMDELMRTAFAPTSSFVAANDVFVAINQRDHRIAELVAALENLIAACTHANPGSTDAAAQRVAAKRIARAALARAKEEA